MYYHLLPLEQAEQLGDTDNWRIQPLIPLKDLAKDMMVPMAGEPLELRLPDGRVVRAQVASFGVEAWRDSSGNLYISTDPSDPSLTLVIALGEDLTDVPPGTEVWPSEATWSEGAEDAGPESAS